ncbi:MAG: hypothetical protein LLG01_02085 [Planctomycetaceae bacterium]|nr:hypothetical protein [Planctomycetaceae bacterium]
MKDKESRTIRVLKRDGTVELFDVHKLAAAMWRAMQGTPGEYFDALHLSAAIEMFLMHGPLPMVSSGSILEMAVKVLGKVGLGGASRTLGTHSSKRGLWRRGMCICHGDDRTTYWDKAWVAELAAKSWHLMPATGRIIAGEVETELRRRKISRITRGKLVELLNRRVVAMGLADAVPVTTVIANP